MKFPVKSLLAGNFADFRDGFARDCRQSVSLPQPLSKVENPAFRAGLRGWLGDRVGRDAGMF